MKYVSVEFKSEIEERLKDSDRLVFLLNFIKSGKYQLITGADGGGYRTLSYEEVLHIVKKEDQN